MSIGTNIKAIRESHHLSQIEFGKIAGVSDKAVSTWENDIKVPRMGAVQKISNYFGIPKSAIIDEQTDLQEDTPITDNDIKFALFNGSEGITDEMYDEVKQFAEMVKLREEQKKKGKK